MITLEHVAELLLQPAGRLRLRDAEVMRRYHRLAPRYAEVCNRMLGPRGVDGPLNAGYDWGSWSAGVRKSFERGVPFRFLAHPVLRQTMVYARRRGMRSTAYRTGVVAEIYGDEVASRLLREDALGGPTITTLRYLTSANRAHHAMHLAEYRRVTQRDFWGASSFVEWGGGYGNMARLIRRMRPDATYTIIDLPELCALQYVYLGSLEGEDAVHVFDGTVRPGRINLMSTYERAPVRAEAFISTWALTESPAAAQREVAAADFFGADRVLMASNCNEYNVLSDGAAALGLRRVPIASRAGLSPGNEYWVR